MAQPRISFFLESVLGLIGAVLGIKKQKKIDFFQNYKKMIHITAQKKGKNTAKTLKWMCLKPVEGWLMKIWLRNWSSKIFPSPFNTMFIRQLKIKGLFRLVYLIKSLIKNERCTIAWLNQFATKSSYQDMKIWFDLLNFILIKYSKKQWKKK